MNDLDPLSNPVDSSAPVAAESPAPDPEHKTLPRSNRMRWLTLGVIGVGLVGFGYYFWGNDDPAARAKNEIVPKLNAVLGVERDYEWTAAQGGHDDNWKKSQAWLAKAKVSLSEAAVRSEIDPWRSERWEIEYRAGHTLESYVRELDALNIEIGLLGMSADGTPGDPVYLSELTNAVPKTRNGKLSEEKRYYMLWKVGSLKSADGKLFATAKLDSKGKYVAHFYPSRIEADMVAAEMKFAAGHLREDIRKTVFSIRPQGNSVGMAVVKQEYHDGTTKEISAGDSGYEDAAKPSKMSSPAVPTPEAPAPETTAPVPAGDSARLSPPGPTMTTRMRGDFIFS